MPDMVDRMIFRFESFEDDKGSGRVDQFTEVYEIFKNCSLETKS